MNKLIGPIIIFFLAMIPTFFSLHLLIYLFPFTGLGRIVSYPCTVLLNALIISIFLFLKRKEYMNLNRLFSFLIWISIFTINACVAISLHPQDTFPSVWERIHFSINAIHRYDSLKISDLEIIEQDRDPFRNGNSELYVVALYKFKNEKLLDRNSIFSSSKEKKLENDSHLLGKETIKSQLPSYEKLIWTYLEISKS